MSKVLSLVSSLKDNFEYWAPLTVGFVLNGTDNGDQTIWYFDERPVGPSYNIVYNKTFQDSGPHTVRVETGKWINTGWKRDATTESITINVRSAPPQNGYIGKIDQMESVIINGQNIGISVSSPALTPINASWIWNWGDSATDGPQRNYSNPSHIYNEAKNATKKYTVQLALSQYLGPPLQDHWSFPVMVLSIKTPTGGNIVITDTSGNQYFFWVGGKLSLSVQPDNSDPKRTAPILRDPNATYEWSLKSPPGSNAILSNPNSQTPSFVPDISGSYNMACNVMSGNIIWWPLSKNIYILNKPSIIPNISQDPTGAEVIVTGDGFPSGIDVAVMVEGYQGINTLEPANSFGQFTTKNPLDVTELPPGTYYITATDTLNYVNPPVRAKFQILTPTK
ncbi:MAG: hypothetical protein WA799_01325 [Nitrosotalea sp.]